jgi:ABC-type multidrug transport system fused ATPase/permease subunit
MFGVIRVSFRVRCNVGFVGVVHHQYVSRLTVQLEEDRPTTVRVRNARRQVSDDERFSLFNIDGDFFAGFETVEEDRRWKRACVGELKLVLREVFEDTRVKNRGDNFARRWCSTEQRFETLGFGIEVSIGKRFAGATFEFNQVNFRYNQDRSIWALRDIDLTIPSNRTTALVGPSGAGKSTMADLLMGLLLPQDGDLQVDGKVLTEEQLWHWRQRIGYVPQETFLLHDSIRNNLLWAEPDATAEELQRVLEMSCADRFVDRLPDGIETVVGDRGVRLSGGERQRLALARALLRRPDLLILDEATSHLDAENQQRIHESIQRMQGRLTVVIIAHRLSTIRDADQIICLDKGLVVETGSYRDLSERPESVFNSLIRADDRTGSSAG